MSTLAALQLFFQIIWMMVGTPIIGIPMAGMLAILLLERIKMRQYQQAARH